MERGKPRLNASYEGLRKKDKSLILLISVPLMEAFIHFVRVMQNDRP